MEPSNQTSVQIKHVRLLHENSSKRKDLISQDEHFRIGSLSVRIYFCHTQLFSSQFFGAWKTFFSSPLLYPSMSKNQGLTLLLAMGIPSGEWKKQSSKNTSITYTKVFYFPKMLLFYVRTKSFSLPLLVGITARWKIDLTNNFWLFWINFAVSKFCVWEIMTNCVYKHEIRLKF